MNRQRLVLVLSALAVSAVLAVGMAQPFVWPPEYMATVSYGGEVHEDTLSDFTTLSPVITANASESAVIGLFAGPTLVYRDWLGTRSFRDEDGNWNMFFASEVEELVPDQDFIITIREGWYWSDGVEMTADDLIAAHVIFGDEAIGSNAYVCSIVGEDPTTLEKLGRYQVRLTLPEPWVNSLAAKDCGTLPAHVFMPVYQAQGAEGILAFWGVDTPPEQFVSGGPYLLTEYRIGERIVLERNPRYGEFVKAADGSPVPGPDRWIVTVSQDANAVLARVVTGQSSAYWPDTADRLRAVVEAVNSGSIQGRVYPNVAPSTSTDFITYRFDNPDACKADMFRNPIFRQAVNIMIDRNSLVQGAVGGLGYPAKNWTSAAAAPFDGHTLSDIVYDPEAAVAMLASIGFTETGPDGVLRNPTTGCRASYELMFNTGNTRRAQLALIVSQSLADHGIEATPREVSIDIWSDAIEGLTQYDALIWGLAGGDMDNPAAYSVFGINQSLAAWNRDPTNVAAWEILMDQLSNRMATTLDLDERVAIFNERAELMAEFLPMTPLINQAFHFYENLNNVWTADKLDPNSIQSPYRPGAFRENLMQP